MKIVHLSWSPNDENLFATAGKDHLCICTVNDKIVEKKMGTGGDTVSHCAAAWVNNPNLSTTILTAGADGKIHQWNQEKLTKSYPVCDKGAIQSIACRLNAAGEEIVLAGGNCKNLMVFKFDGSLKKMWQVMCDAAPRSVDMFGGAILVGLKNGSICELPWTDDGSKSPKVVMTSHCDGETWGLCVCTTPSGETRVITSGDDNRLLAYNPKTYQVLAEGQVNDPGKAKKSKPSRGGASSMSSQPANCQSRCVAYCSKLNQLAVADNTGIVTIREIDWDAVDQGLPGCLDNIKKRLFTKTKNTEWIETMHYSPDGKTLAIGSHDNNIYLVNSKTLSVSKPLKGHSSFITALDWSQDGGYIRSVCGAYELLFFKGAGKAWQRDPSGASNTIETTWTNQTCKFGWSVQGIFPPGCDGSHINSVCMSSDQKLIASGDDYGLVCLYRNPLLEGNDSGKYRGHSEFVTHVAFSDDCKYLWSTGGQDQTTI